MKMIFNLAERRRFQGWAAVPAVNLVIHQAVRVCMSRETTVFGLPLLYKNFTVQYIVVGMSHEKNHRVGGPLVRYSHHNTAVLTVSDSNWNSSPLTSSNGKRFSQSFQWRTFVATELHRHVSNAPLHCMDGFLELKATTLSKSLGFIVDSDLKITQKLLVGLKHS